MFSVFDKVMTCKQCINEKFDGFEIRWSSNKCGFWIWQHKCYEQKIFLHVDKSAHPEVWIGDVSEAIDLIKNGFSS